MQNFFQLFSLTRGLWFPIWKQSARVLADWPVDCGDNPEKRQNMFDNKAKTRRHGGGLAADFSDPPGLLLQLQAKR